MEKTENIMTAINIKKLKQEAQELFESNKYNCSGAVAAAIKNNVAPDMPAALIKAATGFGGGVGKSKCMCGTVSGGVLCLGYFFGRTVPTTVTDPKSLKSLSLANELQEGFRKNHKVLCCNALCKNGQEHCKDFVQEMVESTALILSRELNIKTV